MYQRYLVIVQSHRRYADLCHFIMIRFIFGSLIIDNFSLVVEILIHFRFLLFKVYLPTLSHPKEV